MDVIVDIDWQGTRQIEKRLPNTFDVNQPIDLLDIDKESGWVGNRSDFIIYPYNCYDEGIDTLSWLSNTLNAQNWQYFVSDSTITLLTAAALGAAVGMSGGSIGITTAHELIHRKN